MVLLNMDRKNTGDLVIVSMHEKGFPQADLYCKPPDGHFFGELSAPDDFFTMKNGDTLEMASISASVKWPGASISFAEEEPDEDEE